MARIRERLAETSDGDRRLRVMLVLAHEALRNGEAGDARSAQMEGHDAGTSPAPPVGAEDYSRLVSRIHDLVAASVPTGARLLVVTRGDDTLLVPGYEAAHFPKGKSGGYAGYYPKDSEAAIAHLEQCRADGAEFLVVPATSYWWLDYYGDLARHLVTAGRVAHHDEHCLICDFRPQREGASTE